MHIESFTPLPSLLGGMLIGLSASLLLLTHGRVAGISGIVAGVLPPRAKGSSFRVWFLAGLFLAGLVTRLVWPAAFASLPVAGLGVTAIAGLLVGFGTRLGGGCTSGHGVCGLSQLSVRSLVATLAFMATGMATVYVVRHLLGGGS
ncbi:MAG: putative transrane protein [Myxococcaceae bacterium]|nr:putative transrane protein [Myxococcaceae bacterium]